ncbi:MAG: hypothetical protein NTZ53_01230 [Cyanobacteria bacterium]|nr:hypothetical protein [Cyanobacteriota bacterium]
MSTSPSLETSPLTSKQEYYSSLPWFRRCLAMLNWRPVVDYELREIEFDRKEIEYKLRMQQLQNEEGQLLEEEEQLRIEEQQRQIAHEQRMKQLKKESEQLESEDELLRIEEHQRQIAHEQRMKQLESEIAQIEKETARLDELNSKIDTLFSSSSTNSTPHQNTPDSSEAVTSKKVGSFLFEPSGWSLMEQPSLRR